MLSLKTDSILIYGAGVVCKVIDISRRRIGNAEREYYVLKPLYDDKSTIYVPTDNEALCAKIKQILSPEEIYELIRTMPDAETIWIADDRERSERYKAILESGDRAQIIAVVKTLYLRKKELTQNGKKLRFADEGILSQAEKPLYDEFAVVLDIKREDVLSFICGQIECREKVLSAELK